MHSEILTVSLGERAYDIFFGSRIYPLFQEWICRFYPGGSVFVVTDRNVHAIYGDDIRNWLSGIAHEVLPLSPGEEGKSWEQVREIYSFLARHGAGRDSLVVAFGGGVVGDMAGFAAATFLRGIPYVQIPTTLLSQVDSSVGGKTGFNLREGKNLVGSFHQPRAVFIDNTFLLTLDERNLRSGMAEVLKCALAGDGTLLDLLEGHGEKWRAMPARDWRAMVRGTVAFKAAVVERDERESSARRILNLGHTVGHALEQATGYSRHLHGEAVAMGLAWELLFSRRQGVTPPEVTDRTIRLLLAFGFSLDDPDIPLPSIASAVGMDKKRVVAEIEMPQVTAAGECELRRIPVALLRRELPGIRAEIREILQGRTGDAAAGPGPLREERGAPEEDGPPPESIPVLEQRVMDDPRNLSALLLLAEAYRRAGNGSGAWETAKEALRQYPSDPRAQRAARQIEQEFGDAFPAQPEEEFPLLEDLLILEEGSFELRPADVPEAGDGKPAREEPPAGSSPVRTITMADVYWKQGRRREALEIVEGILENHPADPRALAWKESHRPEAPEGQETKAEQSARETAPVIHRLQRFLQTIAKEYGYVLSGNP